MPTMTTLRSTAGLKINWSTWRTGPVAIILNLEGLQNLFNWQNCLLMSVAWSKFCCLSLKNIELVIDQIHRLPRPSFLPYFTPRDVILLIHFYHVKEQLVQKVRALGMLLDPYSCNCLLTYRSIPCSDESDSTPLRNPWGTTISSTSGLTPPGYWSCTTEPSMLYFLCRKAPGFSIHGVSLKLRMLQLQQIKAPVITNSYPNAPTGADHVKSGILVSSIVKFSQPVHNGPPVFSLGLFTSFLTF